MNAVGEELAVSTPHTGLSSVLDTLYVIVALLFAWQVLHWLAGGLVVPSPLGAANRLALIAADPEFCRARLGDRPRVCHGIADFPDRRPWSWSVAGRAPALW
jgi:hypothetical protein